MRQKSLERARVGSWLGVSERVNATDYYQWCMSDLCPVDFDIWKAVPSIGKPHELNRMTLPPDIAKVWDQSGCSLNAGRIGETDYIDLRTGKKMTRAIKAEIVQNAKDDMLEDLQKKLDAEKTGSSELLADQLARHNALHNQSSVWHKKRWQKYALQAAAYAPEVYFDHCDEEDVYKQLELALIFPLPAYRSRAETLRTHPSGQFTSFTSLKDVLFNIIMQGVAQADLKSLHAALMAQLWLIPELRQIIEEGSLWDYLADELGLPRGFYKPELKEAIYSLMYSMNKSSVAAQLTRETRIDKLGIRFNELPAIKAVYKAREKAVKQAIKTGLTGLYGERYRVPNDAKDKRKEACRAIALQMQAYETYLMAPIFHEASDPSPSIRVVISKHDGVCLINASKTSDPIPEREKRRLSELVDKRARQLGIKTQLEWIVIKPPEDA